MFRSANAQASAAQSDSNKSLSDRSPARPLMTAATVSELKKRRSETKMPGEDLTIAETLRVMDVAREMRQQRETAEEMFRHDAVRVRLREKLMRTAEMSGDRVTETEIDAAIDQYLATLHTYQKPEPGIQHFLAHLWIDRYQVIATASAIAVAISTALYFFL